jgi:hypothetical protein
MPANPLQVPAIPASPQEAFHPRKDDVARRPATKYDRSFAGGLFHAPRLTFSLRQRSRRDLSTTIASREAHDAAIHPASNRTPPFATTVASIFADRKSGIHDTWSHNGLGRSIGSSRDGLPILPIWI